MHFPGLGPAVDIHHEAETWVSPHPWPSSLPAPAQCEGPIHAVKYDSLEKHQQDALFLIVDFLSSPCSDGSRA